MRLLIAMAFIALATPAGAVDFSKVLVDDDGCSFKDTITTIRSSAAAPTPASCPKPPAEGLPDLTLGNAIYYALRASYTDDDKVKIEDKLRRGELAIRLRSATDYTTSTDDVSIIKTYINKLWPIPIITAIVRAIAPGDLPK